MAEAEFSIHPEQCGERVVLRVRGELDLSTAGRLRQAVRDALRGGVSALALDLADVSFADSSGLQAIMVARIWTREQGAAVVVLGASSHLQRLFQRLGLDQVFAPAPEGEMPEP